MPYLQHEAWGDRKGTMRHFPKALTIRQPWAWLIVSGQKDIENRTWKTNYRGPLLIHAASSFAHMSFEEIEDRYRVKLPTRDKLRRGGIVGICDLVDCVTKHRSKWFGGPYGFVLRNAKARRFEPMNGRLNLWDYPP
jgi:hypothetical protein